MLRRLMHSGSILAVLAFVPIATISGETSSPAVQPKHGLTGSYYVSTLETHSDVNPSGQDWYVQVWSDPNDFQLPRPFTSPAAVRVDPQIAFGKGKGFVMQSGRRTTWWPTDSPIPAGWTGWRARDPTTKPSDWLAAVIWKGHVHLPKAGTYYFATISNGPAAVYLGQSRVALAGPPYSGILAADAFTYAKDDIQDFVQYLGYGREDLALRARPEGTYVVPVTIDRPRDLPIEVRHTVVGKVNPPIGIDLFWVTPDSPRDSAGKTVAQIVPTDALYVDPPGALEKPTVRGANSMLSADFLYFPAERTDKDVSVTIRLADKNGNPVAGKRVHVVSLVSYGGADAIRQPETPTNEKGETTARIRPGQSYKVTHDSNIFATDVTDLVDVAQVAHVTFQAGTVATSFFADSFSPYYDPDLIKVEPLPLMVGRPVTISAALENRGKQAAELAAIFKVNHWNIGAASWTEIGKVEHIQLRPGEARRVSVNWTPGEAQTHQCFRVELSGRILWTAIRPSGGPRPASAMVPALWAQAGAAPQNSNSIQDSMQRNMGAVTTATSNCPPPNVKYTGEIACDCDADGQDESRKVFESCGPPGWPTSFRSRCEDWVRDGGYGYSADPRIQHAGRAYLESLNCPALNCYRDYGRCEWYARTDYDKCSFKAKMGLPSGDCLSAQSAADNKCEQERNACLTQTHLFPPSPHPLPTPTPSAPGQASAGATQDERIDWMAIDRAKLTVVVDLASDTSVADAQERDRILNRLYEQIESVRTEGVSSGLSDAPLDTKYTTLVVAAGQGPVDYLLARRRSYARFRGAQAAGDSELMAKQWTATRKYAALAAQRLLTQAKLDEDAAAILEKVSFALRRPPDRAALYLERLKREGLSTEHRKLLQKSGLGPEEIDAYQKVLQATPPGQLGLSIMELHTSVGQFRRALATSLERSDGVGPEPLSLTYFVGNPHERQETIDLFIRPISIPSDWKLSIVNSGQPQRQAPRGDDARQFPVSAIEAGKHYAVTLPAKGQVKVDSVLVPVGEIGAHTTARWAVEGKIRDELIGGMVHETNAPYLVADLKLPAVGSKEEEEIELPAARRMPSTVIVAVSAGVVILASFALLIWKRRRRARGLP